MGIFLRVCLWFQLQTPSKSERKKKVKKMKKKREATARVEL